MNASKYLVADGNNVSIGSVSLERLKQDFGTSLYVVDEQDFIDRAKVFKDNFKSSKFETRILYASKAFTNLYMAGLVDSLGLYTDVVSGGEIYISLKAGEKAKNLYFHGNNKLRSELEQAVDADLGTIVIDNESEYELLDKILKEKNKVQACLLRINPSIDAHTHKYIQTGGDDSKFGMSVHLEQTKELIKKISKNQNFDFRGFHCHIGSQIHDEKFFFFEVEVMLKYAKDIENNLNIKIREMNFGGGFGVYYTSEDKPFDLETFLQRYAEKIEEKLLNLDMNLETVSIEPGRSLINQSITMLYEVGVIKTTSTGLNYIFVDGGMTDNIRPALYGAKYEAFIANKISEEPTTKYTIAGKCCESGDILVKDVMLPKASAGDLLMIPNAGAYTYAMASNYNKLSKPAVVFVKNAKAKLAVRRQSFEDLVSNDEVYKNE